MALLDVHEDGSDEKYVKEHNYCPDLNCCGCECRTCKREWESAGRPTSMTCKKHKIVDSNQDFGTS